MQAVTTDDIYRHRHLQDLSASPHHTHVVVVMSRANRDSDSYRSTAWQFDTAPDAPRGARRLTSPDFNARSIQVAPDGQRVAFISQRDPKAGPQAQMIRLDGGEAEAITNTKDPISSLIAWSADGTKLLALQSVKWKEDERDDPKAKNRPIVVRYLPYKLDGSGTKTGERTRLVSIDARSGDITPLVEGDFDVSDAIWSPDGSRLAFSRKRDGAQRHQADLWLADADGTNAHRVTTDLYSVSGIRFSPDGRRLAFGAGRIEGDSLVQLYVYDIESGRCTSPKGDDLELEGATVIWHRDGDRIATIASRRGLFEIAVLHVDSGEVTTLAHRLRHVTALAASGDGLVFVAASVRRLDEVHRIDWDGANERRLTAFNRKWFGERLRPRVSKRRFEVPDAKGGTETIEAFVLLPPKGDGPFPALVDFHGGPQSIALLDFASHVYWYPLIAKGYAVIAPNPVGSGSYGGEFARRLIGHWGEYDLPQVEAVLEQLRRQGVIGKSIGCYGKSYGGYLSAWSAAMSEMFEAAVVSAPVANLQSHGGTSDTGYYVTPYAMGADLHECSKRYARLSPVEHAAKVDTATLLLNGQDDQRCPVGQCEELFANLIRAGHRECMMVVYPGGSHSLSGSGTPSHRVDYHERVVNWIVDNV
ncbi:S9 family peptidase [Cognatilysobacter terrigena]|uniref:S9 family peptidase n=1 Tax=Cognatilysobacter terrigena TaxID=2488749 RepID=UPI0010608D69|nr:S9 family peptidase [Lysobacter terrigena]